MSSDRERTAVVVTGLGVVCAVARGARELDDALRQGRCGIGLVRAFSTDGLRCHHAGEVGDPLAPPPGAGNGGKPLDRASVLALLAAEEAVQDSGLLSQPALLRDAVLAVGTCGGGYLGALRYLRRAEAGRRAPLNPLLELPLHAAPSRICRRFGVRGGLHVVSNACASSAVAVSLGIDLIRAGRTSTVLAGGFDALSPLSFAGFATLRNSSPSGVMRPFDRHRDGMILGEGAGMVVLESVDQCRRRGGKPLATLLGSAVTSDNFHLTAPDPSGRGAATAMREALEDAAVEAERIDYVNAHGTATPHNDAMEAMALKRVFGRGAATLPVSSIKPMVGHTLGAAGVIELIATIVAMRSGFLPPTLHHRDPDPSFDLDVVPNRSRPATLRTAMSNSFGFGGANCSLVVATGDRS